MKTLFRRGRFSITTALFSTIAVAGFGAAVQALWNWPMPGIFGLTAIIFWQAVGSRALSWLLSADGAGWAIGNIGATGCWSVGSG